MKDKEHTSLSQMGCRDLLEVLKKSLVNIGVPERFILLEPILRFPNGDSMHADAVVMAEDGKTVLAQFEVKLSRLKSISAFEAGRLALHEAIKWHRCFVVTVIENACVIADAQYSKAQWTDIAQLTEWNQLFGNYEVNSTLAVENRKTQNSARQQKMMSIFVWGVIIVGVITISVAGWLECTQHHVFSRRLYALLCYILALIAAASGFYIKADFGHFGVTVCLSENLAQNSSSKTRDKQ